MSTNRMSAPATDEREYDAIVVGAGFAGMYMLHRLRELGLRARVFDAASDVGGTWFWNRYPGARCDVVSVDYSYSFSDEIQQEWNWSEKFAAQPEILAYARFVADKLDLRRDIRFDTRIVSAVYDEEDMRWVVSSDNDEEFSARFCIMATGCLSIPKTPDIPGLADFKGETYFTSRWPDDRPDFGGKRVGLLGTGSSGIQVAPQLADMAERLLVFQRSATFTLPARNAPLPPSELEAVKARYMERREKARRHPAGHLRPMTDRKTLTLSEDERRERFEDAWRQGGLAIFGEFGDILTDEVANAEITRYVFEKIDQLVADPATARALKPQNTPFAGKRICLDTDFYETFNRDNVELVDLSADPIDRILPDGVQTRSHTYPLDALVLAVGFDAMTGALLAMNIRGRDGVALRDVWADGPASYLGLAVEGFPNLFTITGPGSPSVLSNVIASIEQHVEWLAALLYHMRDAGLAEVEATETAQSDWVTFNYGLAKKSLMMKANSWYLGANIPGKPRIFMPFAGGLNVYRDICDGIAAQEYRGFRFARSDHRSGSIHAAPAAIRP